MFQDEGENADHSVVEVDELVVGDDPFTWEPLLNPFGGNWE